MAVYVAYGPPGSGKSYFAVWWSRRAILRKRRVFCTFPMAGTRGLLTLAHAWCEEFAGSDFIVDEAGSMFNSRDFANLDPLVFGALTHSRHQDVNIIFLCQHPMYLESNFRRVAETFIRIQRIGPSGERARSRKGMKRSLLTKLSEPLGFAYSYFTAGSFTAEYTLKPKSRPKRVHLAGFNHRYAALYDSFNHVPPPSLRRSVQELQASAAACAAIEPWQFRDGKPLPVAVPDLTSLSFPIRDSDVQQEIATAKELDKMRLLKAEVKEQARIDMLAQMGYLNPTDAKAHMTIRYTPSLPLSGPLPSPRRLAGGDGYGEETPIIEEEAS